MDAQSDAISDRRRWTGKSIAVGVLLLIGIAIVLLVDSGAFALPTGLTREGALVAGVMICMATLWIFEVVPIAATALIPLAVFPVLTILPGKVVAKAYTNHIIMLLLGGFLLAKGLERWDVPQRMALSVERWAKGEPRRLVYGLVGTTAVLSMWLSNTATTLVMVTVAIAAARRAEASEHNTPLDASRFRLALLLGVAYAANIGGMATPVGTAPNALFLTFYEKIVPGGQVSFLMWMIVALPVVVILLPIMTWMLTRVLCPFPADLDLGSTKQKTLPPLGNGARRALIIFGTTALLWVFRKDLNLEVVTIPGWAGALGLSKWVDDGTVAMMGAFAMFACPAGEPPSDERGLVDSSATNAKVLDWDSANSIPWYLLLLFGGGLALAEAFGATGLSLWLGNKLEWLSGAPLVAIVFVLCLGMSLLTEVTSNTATTTLLLPVLGAAALALDIAPALLMLPAALCASAAFILPISTPPNAIAAGAGNIAVQDMARVGVAINGVAVTVITLLTVVWFGRVLGV